MVLIMNQTLTK